MHSREFDFDIATGKREIFHYHPETDEFTIQTQLDVGDVLEANKQARSMHNPKAARKWAGSIHHVAKIPDVIWAQLKRDGIADDEKALMRWLDDPANSAFRSKPGRLSK